MRKLILLLTSFALSMATFVVTGTWLLGRDLTQLELTLGFGGLVSALAGAELVAWLRRKRKNEALGTQYSALW
ncbi:MAG: hypothetical protein Q7T87_12655 [Polaromonas sp.]|nr:hypothetical protein [Polaromonas sp.]